MRKSLLLILLLPTISMIACKKAEDKAPVETTPTTSTAPVAQPEKTKEEMTEAQEELAKKQALLDYATMEDTYINDQKAQWATAATASSTFGDDNGKTPADSNTAKNLTGKIDDSNWTNNNQDIGFDWVVLDYGKPVAATEVRLVMPNGNTPESISKVELQDTEGKWNTIWSGISDVKNDDRGRRTWFVKTFPKTTYQVKSVKFTFSNNLSRGYKEANAAQLVGE